MRMTADKLTDHADWKDGMNVFRLKVYQDIKRLDEEIKKLKQQIKETP